MSDLQPSYCVPFCYLIWHTPTGKPSDTAIEAISGLTRGLKLTLLAEGVENERQLDMLKGLGCQYGQGYYWSKAIPGDEYEQFYMNQIYNIG